MRILFVTPSFPFPPNDGGRLGFYNPIKYLSRRQEIVLVSFGGADNSKYVSEMKRFCIGVETFRQSQRGNFWGLAAGLVMNPPGSLAKYWDPAFGDFMIECISRYKPDLVELQHLSMAAYRKYVSPSIPVILREHNVEYKVWERQSNCARSRLEWGYVRLATPRIRAYEGNVASRFARCVTVSEADARHLRAISPRARVEVIPSGVDTEYFCPVREAREEPYSLTLTGSFEWPPKQRSLWVLITEIFPRVKARLPKAKLYVVGKGVPREMGERAERMPGVVVTGAVGDVRPYISRSSIVVQYLESGGGIALKLLEAMAMRKPVLSNRLGCEGIDLEAGRDCLLADGVENFANTAVQMLSDSDLRQRLADEGYKRIQEAYAWHGLAGRFEKCYAEVLDGSRRAGHAKHQYSSYAESAARGTL